MNSVKWQNTRINIQNPAAFLYINNELKEEKEKTLKNLKNKIPSNKLKPKLKRSQQF